MPPASTFGGQRHNNKSHTMYQKIDLWSSLTQIKDQNKHLQSILFQCPFNALLDIPVGQNKVKWPKVKLLKSNSNEFSVDCTQNTSILNLCPLTNLRVRTAIRRSYHSVVIIRKTIIYQGLKYYNYIKQKSVPGIQAPTYKTGGKAIRKYIDYFYLHDIKFNKNISGKKLQA